MSYRKKTTAGRPSWIKNILFSITAAWVLGYMFVRQRLLAAYMGSRLLVEQAQQHHEQHHMKISETINNGIMGQLQPGDTTNDVPREKQESISEKPCDVEKRQSETTTEESPKYIEWLPPCESSSSSNSTSSPFWLECDPGPNSIDVILTVYRRDNLRLQLEMLVNQTLQPQSIFVYQSERYLDVKSIVQEFQSKFATYKVPIHLVQAPVDSAGYHGRFYMAYTMSRARYVSIWDDDVSAGTGWLQRVATFLSEHDDKYIVSSGGRMVQSLVDPTNATPITSKNKKDRDSQEFKTFGMLAKRQGEVDFCVHNYNLRRELLRYWLGSPVHTYYTGEDMQLAFALQQYGVRAFKLGPKLRGGNDDWADGAKGLGANNKNKASYKKKRNEPRQWLICKLVLGGFQTINCSNCNSEVAKRCTDYYESLEISVNRGKG